MDMLLSSNFPKNVKKHSHFLIMTMFGVYIYNIYTVRAIPPLYIQ
jgi:hypothetical protein